MTNRKILYLPEKLQALRQCQRDPSPYVHIVQPEIWVQGYQLYAVPEWIWNRDHLIKTIIFKADKEEPETPIQRISMIVTEIISPEQSKGHGRKASSFSADNLVHMNQTKQDLSPWIVKVFGECAEKNLRLEMVNGSGSILLSHDIDILEKLAPKPIRIPSGDFDAILPVMIPFLSLYRFELIDAIDLKRDINSNDFQRIVGSKIHLQPVFETKKWSTELVLEILISMLQNILYYFGFLSAESRDGLVCDETVSALEQFFFAMGPFDMSALDTVFQTTERPSKSYSSPWMHPSIFLILYETLVTTQESLSQLGFPPPKGPSTTDMNGFRKQIKHFQKARNLKVTMILDRPTMLRLKSDLRLYAERHGLDNLKFTPSNNSSGSEGRNSFGVEGAVTGLSRRLLRSSGAIGGLANKFGLLDDFTSGVFRVDSFESSPVGSSSHGSEILLTRNKFVSHVTECLESGISKQVQPNLTNHRTPRRGSDATGIMGGPPFLLTTSVAKAAALSSGGSSPSIMPLDMKPASHKRDPSPVQLGEIPKGRRSSSPQNLIRRFSFADPDSPHRRSPSLPSIQLTRPSPSFDRETSPQRLIESPSRNHGQEILHSAHKFLVKKPKKAAKTVIRGLNKGIVQPTADMIGDIVKKTAAGVSQVVSGTAEIDDDQSDTDYNPVVPPIKIAQPNSKSPGSSRQGITSAELLSPVNLVEELNQILSDSDQDWYEVEHGYLSSDDKEARRHTGRRGRSSWLRGRSLDRLGKPKQRLHMYYLTRSNSADRIVDTKSSPNETSHVQLGEYLDQHYAHLELPTWISQVHEKLDMVEQSLDVFHTQASSDVKTMDSTLLHLTFISEHLSSLIQKKEDTRSRLQALQNDMKKNDFTLETMLMDMERANEQVEYRLQSSSHALKNGQEEYDTLLSLVESVFSETPISLPFQ